jgi:Fe-S-cluster containining protein
LNISAAIGINGSTWGEDTVVIKNGYEKVSINCRLGCGACCIAPSISSAIPGMPKGKAVFSLMKTIFVYCLASLNAHRSALTLGLRNGYAARIMSRRCLFSLI